jgi:cation diffusion facilitator family transporter
MESEQSTNERKTLWVVLLTAFTMVIEVVFGLITGSMALLADGIHMGSHVFAVGLSWLAYVWVRHLSRSKKHNGDTEKILALSGYTSGLILLIFAVFIAVEAIQRFFVPAEIVYRDALIVATLGLIVNLISARLLHHDENKSDHNIKAAYFHVLADALTSLAAIAGLLAARYFQMPFIDPLVAIISSAVIVRWAVGLLFSTGKSLLGFHKKS